MKNKLNFFNGLTAIVLTAILFSSCSKVPQTEIDAANAAIEDARAAGAEQYVYDNFIALQDSMNSIMVNIETKNSKLIKNYSSVKEDLAGVTQLALEVKQQTETRIEEVKVEIQTTIAEVKTLIETNRQLITQAPRGKEGTTALVAIRDELNTIETTINEVSSTSEQGDYLATLDKAKAAKEKATAINTELEGVIAKYIGTTRN